MQQYYGGAYRKRRGSLNLKKLNLKSLSRMIKDPVFISRALKFAVIGLFLGLGLLFVMFLWISKDLPTPGKLSNLDITDSTKILDRNDKHLYSIYKEYNRTYVKLDDIPENLRNATIVAEDSDFYTNKGYSLRGYARVLKDFILYRRVTGGSTITQQLVKNVLLSPERTVTRKFKELVLAVQVDRRYSKDQILEMYLNNVSYGGTALGVEAASNLYFGKPVKSLNLAQSAFLAGLPQSPSYYSPFIGEDKAYVARTRYVLSRMEDEGLISQKTMDAALKEVQGFEFTEQKATGSIKAPHFVMYVRKELSKMFGEAAVENGNLQVKTTLDYDLQAKAEEIVKTEIDDLKGYNVKNGAAIVMDAKTGQILTMVGNKDYFDTDNGGNFNAAVDGIRQPGSSLKPIAYAVALEKGYTPASVFMDVKTEFPTFDPEKPYLPVNYDGKFRGPVQMRFALGNSLNIPAVKALAKVGIKPVMQKAYDMGIENWKPTNENVSNVGLSLVLGGRETNLLEITTAYGVFANEGKKNSPVSILEVKDSKGKVIYKNDQKDGQQVLTKEVAFLISHILLDNNARKDAFGAFSQLVIPNKTVAVKTGTTDEKRDNWTIGYTPSYVVGVWVGNNDNSQMNPKIASGVTGASPIWNKIIKEVLKDKQNEEFKKPDNVEALEVDAIGGGLPVEGQPKRVEYFIKGTQPTTPSTMYKKVRISKHHSDKLANDEEIAHGDYETKEYVIFEESDPVSTDGKNRWQMGIDEWLKTTYSAAESKYYPPKDKSDYKYGSDNNNNNDKPTPTPTSGSSTPTPSPSPSPSPSPTP